jgi:hypothetical protein
VGPVGLGRRAPHRGATNESVLRLAGLEPLPGGDPDLGPDAPDRGGLLGPVHAGLGRSADLLADRPQGRTAAGPANWAFLGPRRLTQRWLVFRGSRFQKM